MGTHSSAIDQELQLLPPHYPMAEIRASGRRGRAHVDMRKQIGCDQRRAESVMKILWWSKSHWDQLEGEGLIGATETCRDHDGNGKHWSVFFSRPHSSLLTALLPVRRCSVRAVAPSEVCQEGLREFFFAPKLHKWAIKTLTESLQTFGQS